MLAMIPMFYLLFWLSTLTGIHAIVDIKRLQTKFLTGPSATGIDSDPVNNHTFSINGVMIYFARNGTRYCLTERRLELPRYNLPDEDAIILKCNETNLAQRWFVNGTEHARYRNRTRLPSNERTWFTGTIRNSATRRCVYGRVFNTTGSRYQIGEIGLNGLINVDYVPYGRIYLTDCSYDRGPRQIEIDPFEDRKEIFFPVDGLSAWRNFTLESMLPGNPGNTYLKYACLNGTHTRTFLIDIPLAPAAGSRDRHFPAFFGCAFPTFGDTDHSAIMDPSPRLAWIDRARSEFD